MWICFYFTGDKKVKLVVSLTARRLAVNSTAWDHKLYLHRVL